MNNNIDQNKYSIQKDYMNNLENACNNIGINRHEMIYISSATLDAKVINVQIDEIFVAGQKYVYDNRKLGLKQAKILESDTKQLTKKQQRVLEFDKEKFKKDLENYITTIKNLDIHKYTNINSVNKKKEDRNPNAQTIRTDLYNAYNLGLKIGYSQKENNYEIITIPTTVALGEIKHIFSDK